MAIRYDKPTRCTHSCQIGLVRLLNDILKRWPGTQNWGCENCRQVAGGSGLSLHSEGRAIDVGIPSLLKNYGDEIFNWAIVHAEELGLQEIIWYGHIWSCQKPYVRLYRYGPSYRDKTLAHRDHVHIGLNWDGALQKTAYFGNPPITGPVTPPSPPLTVFFIGLVAQGTGESYSPNGFFAARTDGLVKSEGVPVIGDLKTIPRVSEREKIVSIFHTGGKGYYMVGADGSVFAFGDAKYHGGMNAAPLTKPITDGVCDGKGGYWLVGEDGGIFAFGGAAFHGSLGSVPLNSPIVAMEVSATGNGYWLVASDGGVFAYGDAPFLGSMGGMPLTAPVANILRSPTGNGYWLVSLDGGIFSFGDARFYGSYPGLPPEWKQGSRFLVDIARYRDGYMLLGTDGSIYRFHSEN